jgi:hypothetical protein
MNPIIVHPNLQWVYEDPSLRKWREVENKKGKKGKRGKKMIIIF